MICPVLPVSKMQQYNGWSITVHVVQSKNTLPNSELYSSTFIFNFEELYFACMMIYNKSQVSENSTDQSLFKLLLEVANFILLVPWYGVFCSCSKNVCGICLVTQTVFDIGL